MGLRLEVRREQFNLQAYFLSPVFDLFKDFPSLAHHLFQVLGGHGLRLTDIRLDSPQESLGEFNLRLTWPELAVARLFLDRVELTSSYPRFFDLREGSLIPDLLGVVESYSPEISFRAFAVSRELHGALETSPKEFLSRFSSALPQSFGPSLGSGTVFYFGPADNRFTGSLTLDFSRLVDPGLFLKFSAIYDAAQLGAADLLKISRLQSANLFEEVGLDLAGD